MEGGVNSHVFWQFQVDSLFNGKGTNKAVSSLWDSVSNGMFLDNARPTDMVDRKVLGFCTNGRGLGGLLDALQCSADVLPEHVRELYSTQGRWILQVVWLASAMQPDCRY